MEDLKLHTQCLDINFVDCMSLTETQASFCLTDSFMNGNSLYCYLPFDLRVEFEQLLSVNKPDHCDWRKLGHLVGLKDCTLSLLNELPLERGSEVMKVWQRQRGGSGTLHNLKKDLEANNIVEPSQFLKQRMNQY